jgi:PadR family transcriptional regulator PadR
MNRRRNDLIPLELDILNVGLELKVRGIEEFHGFMVAKEIAEQQQAKALTSHGTLYKALARLAQRELLESRWEPEEEAQKEGRPRRRLYRVTSTGAAELARLARERRTTEALPSATFAVRLGLISARNLHTQKGR